MPPQMDMSKLAAMSPYAKQFAQGQNQLNGLGQQIGVAPVQGLGAAAPFIGAPGPGGQSISPLGQAALLASQGGGMPLPGGPSGMPAGGNPTGLGGQAINPAMDPMKFSGPGQPMPQVLPAQTQPMPQGGQQQPAQSNVPDYMRHQMQQRGMGNRMDNDQNEMRRRGMGDRMDNDRNEMQRRMGRGPQQGLAGLNKAMQ
jgi:hypothetical protein